MNRLIHALVPGFLRRPFRVYRKHQAAVRTDRFLQAIGQELRPELMSETKLVDRLLPHLPGRGIAAEVGVDEGEHVEAILKLADPEKVFLIDLWAGEPGRRARAQVERRFASKIAAGKVVLRQECSWESLATFPDAFFDWVYIDAAHDYDSVKKDLEVSARKVKPDGYICGHDYVLWAEDGLSRFGVVEAVNEFCNAHDYRLAYLTNQKNRHLNYALRKRTP